jgi:2-polyprenyl-3-methyl-5-hydroxy-6-metoxy-1,4-benzoquinol methylase
VTSPNLNAVAAADGPGYNQEQMNGADALHRYAIRRGKQDKVRLDLLARVMLPTTSRLLNTVCLTEGMKCLDVGCGGGHVSLLMASMVGPAGKAVGTDTDKQILDLARQDAEIAKMSNVEFRHADACQCQSREEYDLVYARFLLSHLSEPEKCLEALVKACRPGGIIVVRGCGFYRQLLLSDLCSL